MKKIGILTFHRAINYGAFLQCFALTERLRREFPNCIIEVIDYTAPKEYKKIYKNILRGGYHYGLRNMTMEFKKYRVFTTSLKKLPLSEQKFIKSSINELFEYIDKRYDIIIVGSDSIFNWNQNGFPSAYFLNYDFKGAVLSYAASVHGMRYKELSDLEIQYCRESFSRFEFIGVRDENTKEFIHFCDSNLKCTHNCDPTVFISLKEVEKTAGDFKNRIKNKYGLNFSKPIIAIMSQQESINRIIKESFGKEYCVVSLFKPSKYADVYLYDLNPFEWAVFFSLVKLTFTHYFHGALLTFKNSKPAIVFDCWRYDSYESKLKDLMVRRLNLPDLYYTLEDLSKGKNLEKMITISQNAINGHYNHHIDERLKKESESLQPFLEKIETLL